MTYPVLSTQEDRRCVSFKQRNSIVHKYVLLAGTVLVITFCGIFLLLHFVARDYRGNGVFPKNEFSSADRPKTGFLNCPRCPGVCYTKDCLKTAALVLDMMDPTINPCEDFYTYSCGGYQKLAKENSQRETFLEDMQNNIPQFLIDMIQEIPKSVPENTVGSSITNIRKFYDSCMDFRAAEETAVPTALRYLEHFGIKNWPDLPDDYNFSEPDLDEVLIRLAMYNQFPLFTIGLTDDRPRYRTGSPTARGYDEMGTKIKMEQKMFQIFHFRKFVSESWLNIIKATLDYFVPNDTIRGQIFSDVFAFDLAIVDFTEDTYDRNAYCRHIKNCSALYYHCAREGNQRMGRWCKITKEIGIRSGILKKHPTVPIVIEDRHHFQDMARVIDSTSHRTIAHALALRFFVKNAIAMNFPIRKNVLKTEDRFLREELFEEMNEFRSSFCAMWVCSRSKVLSGAAFYYNKYKSGLGKEMSELFSDLKENSISFVRSHSFVDAEAKQALEEQLSEVQHFGLDYTKSIRNMSAIDELYKKVNMTEESFLGNYLESQKIEAALILRFIEVVLSSKKTRNLTELSEFRPLAEFPFEFKPRYSDHYRVIHLSFGSFAFPVFSADRPRYTNLGFLGVVMGHELGHPIETFLSKYRKKSKTFSDAYKEAIRCVQKHSSEYVIPGTRVKVKGKQTTPGDISDYTGNRIAFESLKKYQENHGVEPRLPGLQFTNEQMFFITAAQDWCETNAPESVTLYYGYSHSPANVRVLGVNKNFDAFSQAFSCPVGSPMNPANKCSID